MAGLISAHVYPYQTVSQEKGNGRMAAELHDDIMIIGMYLHGFEKRILPDIRMRSSLGERWEQAET